MTNPFSSAKRAPLPQRLASWALAASVFGAYYYWNHRDDGKILSTTDTDRLNEAVVPKTKQRKWSDSESK